MKLSLEYGKATPKGVGSERGCLLKNEIGPDRKPLKTPKRTNGVFSHVLGGCLGVLMYFGDFWMF